MFNVNHALFWLSLSAICATNIPFSVKAAEYKDEVYSATFFDQYAPLTALDMVNQLPGFTLIETDDDIRGFATGAGNVLIDGRRPTTKSGGINETLSRIAAAQVAYIEILRGASGSSDAAGQAVVANVVKLKQGAAKHWKLAFEKTGNGELSPSTEWVLSNHIKGWDSAFKFNAISQKSPRDANISIYGPTMELLSYQQETRPSTLNDIFISGDSKKQFNQHTFSINARVGWSQFVTDTERLSYTQPQQSQIINRYQNDRDSQFYTGELGLEWQKILASHWQWRILNINNVQNWFVNSFSFDQPPNEDMTNATSLRFDEHKSEHVLRNVFSRAGGKQDMLKQQEYGLEVAFSNLESWLTLERQNLLASPFTSNRYSQAKEIRGEAFANLNWQWQKLVLDTGIAAEYSQLNVTGDNSDEQSLFFLKPSLALAYNSDKNRQYRISLRRSVGQLDFSDFAASADLVNDREISGNPRLRPETKTKATLAFDQRFAEKGAFSIALYYEWRQHVLEHIILPSGDYALGNAGKAEVKGITSSLNLPLNQWFKGAQIAFQANFIDSSFTDPVTNQNRQLTELTTPDISVDFRQDINQHNIFWGISYQDYQRSKEFYVNEYSHFHTYGRWHAYIEGIAFNDLKIRLDISNIGDDETKWQRKLYQPSRSDTLQQIQITQRHRDPTVNISFSQTF
ncbi:TonB-dependent receptor [Thalassotalea sp. 1_MG-2023]|uniref:TonB-dependent receptor plug domain-containing protein n=1 Tax=Thalassotalea sp. 1_MG-2023 TaxID=3062680 RepID=UPI0026E40064|nr:TonB-dependent receptor [Thalassotalea sp. 1_MG-2023]MDO6426940.1 TonB-dependent receptor [Thalassotalea sp. 1_MG-2023]